MYTPNISHNHDYDTKKRQHAASFPSQKHSAIAHTVMTAHYVRYRQVSVMENLIM